MFALTTVIKSLFVLTTINGCDLMLQQQKYLPGEILTTINKIGQKQCAKRCYVISGCLSYNFQKIQLSCELLLQNSSMVELVDRENSFHEDVDLSYELQTSDSKCQYNSQRIKRTSLQEAFKSCNCANSTMCVRTKNGTACINIACTKLIPTIQNGFPNEDNRTYYLIGDKVKYSCNLGYWMAGTMKSIACKANGEWESTRKIICKVVTCGSPPVYIWKGKRNSNIQRTYRKCVIYLCDTGYNYFGNGRYCCNHVGGWNKVYCHPVPCGAAPSAPTGSRLVSSISNGWYTDERFYNCLPGYKYSDGLNYTICQANRRWTDVNLNCTKVSCGKPELKDFAVLDSDDEGFYLDVRKYTCVNDSLGHKDPSQIICQASGNWTQIICTSDRVNVSETSTIQESTIRRDIYQSSTEISTTENVTFANIWQTTTVIDCGHPPVIWKGSGVRYSGTTINTRAFYWCSRGYHVCRRHSSCDYSGRWLNPDYCHPVSCGYAPRATGFRITSVPTYGWYQDKKKYTCSNGYQYNGGSTYTECQANRTWTYPTINCTRVSCGIPKKKPLAVVNSEDEGFFGDIRTYNCTNGTVGQGNTFIVTCQSSGTWSIADFTCYIPQQSTEELTDKTERIPEQSTEELTDKTERISEQSIEELTYTTERIPEQSTEELTDKTEHTHDSHESPISENQ